MNFYNKINFTNNNEFYQYDDDEDEDDDGYDVTEELQF